MGLNASPVEQTWTAIAGIGLLFTLWMILDSYLDYRVVKKAIVLGHAVIYGPRWWLSCGAIVGGVLMAFVWLGFVGVGFLAMQFPPPVPTPDQTVSNQWVGWILIGMEGILALIQVWTRIVRVQVLRHPLLPTTPRGTLP